LATATLATVIGVPATKAVATPAVPPAPSCSLGNGAQHVVQITFDNVHFFRDNPSVPSDLWRGQAIKRIAGGGGKRTMRSNHRA
jgi:hypothetical protein